MRLTTRHLPIGLLLVFSCAVHGQPYGLDQRPAIGPFLNGVMPESAPTVSGNWVAVVAFANLTFTNAVGLTHVPGTDRLIVWEREGRAWSFANRSDTTQKTLVLDISNQCQGWDDSGLLGLAFHPGFVTNRQMFVYYTWVSPGTVLGDATTRPPHTIPGKYHDRLSRFTLDVAGVAIAGSELVLVDQTGNDTWHNGGGLFFHPDNGFLYWTDGDDANGANNQIINSNLFSGVFRIDVDRRGGALSHPIPRQPANGLTAHYYIPNDNPFVGQPGVLEEFFCLGLRSPHRMTCDPPSGRIFIGDVGAALREEIDIIEPGRSGLNFQWDRIEGLQGDLTASYIGINQRPVLDYTHSEGFAVIGGYVYRGSEFAADLGGKFVFGDNGSRTIWVMDESTVPAGKIALCTLPVGPGPNPGNDYTGLSSFGLDRSNELYICQMSSVGGKIYKLARAGPPPASRPFPLLLSQTGTFQNLATLAPAPGLTPYDVNSPLWSDGAVKTRWMALPTNTFISFAATGEWTFPAGAVFIKHFELPTSDSEPGLRKRLETRLLVCDTNGTVYGASYKWRANDTDAELVSTAINEDVLITTATGIRTQQWLYPGRQDCLRCHTVAAGGVLGVQTRQLNGDFAYASTGVTDNQLRAWNHVALFLPPVSEPAIQSYTKLVRVTDGSAPLEFRVRSYLDANCAQCHRPGGGVQALFDARIDTPLASQGLINGAVLNPLGIAGAKVVAPGDPGKSILFQRDNSLAAIGMPPLARNVIHREAVAMIAAWIVSLPPSTIPLPWKHMDIGSVGIPGDASYLPGQFAMSGSGADIWSDADAFHFVYRPLNGNGEITARVGSLQNTDPWAKAGVMVRETLTPGSRHASAFITSGSGAAFQRRVSSGGVSDHTAGPGVTPPHWVRLIRNGNTFSAYASPNGSAWTFLGSATVSMGSKVFAGLAVTAHNNAALNVAVLDNITGNFGINTAPVITLVQPTNNATFVQPRSIALGATASDADGTVSRVDFLSGPNLLGAAVSSAGNQYSLTWSNAPPGDYSLKARAIDDWGATNYSDPVNILVRPLRLEVSPGPPVNGQFSLSFRGQDNEYYTIETSTNLGAWVPVFTNAPSNGWVWFADLHATNTQRFYRVNQ